MNLEIVRENIKEHSWGWDPKVTQLNYDCIAHKVELLHEEDSGIEVVYIFTNSLKVSFDSSKFIESGTKKDGEYIKTKNLNTGQMECYLYSIEASIETEDEIDFYVVKIDMSPTQVEIWCKDIEIFKREKTASM